LTLSGSSAILSISGTTSSTNNTTGSLLLAGGLSINNTTDATNDTNGGTITTAGGVAIGKSIYIGGSLTLSGTSSIINLAGSSSSVTILGTANAVDYSNGGTITSYGGASFAKNVYIGGNLNVADTIYATHVVTTNSETINISSNELVLNTGSSETGSDSGLLNYRYQVSNILGNGDVVSDLPKESYSIVEATSNTITLPVTASSYNDFYKGWWIMVVSGSANNHVKKIIGYIGSTRVATLEDTFSVVPSGADLINFYNKNYSSFVWDASAKQFVMAYSASDMLFSRIIDPIEYADLRLGKLTLETPLSEDSGGTGQNTYTVGDILVASSSTTLTKISKPSFKGAVLMTDGSALGVSWNDSMFETYFNLGPVIYNSRYSYTIMHFHGRNEFNTDYIDIDDPITLQLDTLGVINGVAASGVLTGTIFPDPESTTIVGTDTLFLTEPIVNDGLIVIGEQTRSVLSITSNTQLTVNSPFTVLNLWTLSGTASLYATKFKFGAKALSATTATAYGMMTLGTHSSYFNPTSLSAWTIEFFVNLNAIKASISICSSTLASTFAISFATASKLLTISLGQGTTMNIANAVTLTGELVANTWYHIAIVFTGSSYALYKNGVVCATIASSLYITNNGFNQIRFGGNGTVAGNSAFDEVRISNVARYNTAFTPTTVVFTSDSNTIALNHFESTTITKSDEMNTGQYQYKSGGFVINTVYYTYALNHPTTTGYYISEASQSSLIKYIPDGYSIDDVKKLPIYFSVQSTGIPYCTMNLSNNDKLIFPHIFIATNLTNTTPTQISLANSLPIDTQGVVLILTHTHVGTVPCGISIGVNSDTTTTFLNTAVAGVNSIHATIPVYSNLVINVNLTAAATTTSYSIEIAGYVV